MSARDLDASIIALLHRLRAECEATAEVAREALGLPAPPTAQQALLELAAEFEAEGKRTGTGYPFWQAAARMALARATALAAGANGPGPVSLDVQSPQDSTGPHRASGETLLDRWTKGQVT